MMAWLVRAAGYAGAMVLALMVLFLFREAGTAGPVALLRSRSWDPAGDPPLLGALPLVAGSLWVGGAALLLAVPVGVAVAAWLTEVAPSRLREWVKPALELAAAVPSVVLGFVGVQVLGPWLQARLGLPTGYTALTGALLLAWMALPTLITLAEEAFCAVPRRLREASAALGATPWETLVGTVLPAAAPQLVGAALLAAGRVLGETMVVLMVTGNVPRLPGGLFQPVQTLTATVAAEMGEVVQGSLHYRALFALGLLLFCANALLAWGASRLCGRHGEGS